MNNGQHDLSTTKQAKGARRAALFVVLCVLLVSANAWTASNKDKEMSVKVLHGQVNEDQDRLVDQAALTAQHESIKRLQRLLTKYRGTSHEPVLLAKLAEIFQQEGSIRFRLAHGRANRTNSALDMGDYKKAMRQSVDTLNHLISHYPDYDEIDLAYFLRGKAYQEIGDKKEAKHDYLTLVKKFPQAPEVTSAYMSLADYEIDDNNHELALRYLSEVEKKPESPQYPFALYKMAWSHYNLKNIPRGLSYLERHIAYFKNVFETSKIKEEPISSSDVAMRENSLMDLAMFYFEGIEHGDSGYQVENALPYFKKQDPGEHLGRMTVRFAKHLRAAGMQDRLIGWKNLMIKDELALPETAEVAMLLFEDQINKRKFTELSETAHDFVTIYHAYPKAKAFDAYTKAQRMLLETAEKIQGWTIKNKKADDLKSLTSTLSALYSSFIDIVDSKDERVPKVHYNLAETLFEIQDYEAATQHYRWVVENWNNQKGFDVKVASIKAIASRYEVLHRSGVIPTELKAVGLNQDHSVASNSALEEWIQWLGAHAKKYSANDETFQNFEFEASRALYVQGQIKRATERMLASAELQPQSKFAMPEASLVLDTYVAAGDWDRTNQMALRLMKVKAWSQTPFAEKLYALAADSFYKTVEIQQKAGDFKTTLSKAEDCVSDYAKSVRYVDCLLMAGKAAVQVGKEEKAESFYGELINKHAGTEPSQVALLERAQIYEKNFKFASAADDFKAYLTSTAAKKISNDKVVELWDRTLQLYWFAGAHDKVIQLTQTLPQCREEILDTCTRLTAFARLASSDPTYAPDALSRVLHGKKEQKALWALVALHTPEKIAFKDRLFLIKSVADNWDKLEPLSKMALLDELHHSVPYVYSLTRKEVAKLTPLKINPKAIKRRVELIQELEGVATAAVKLPWARIRAEMLNEVADLYSEFAGSLRNLPIPDGLPEAEKTAYDESIQKIVFPFEEKGSEIRRKAFELASQFAIDDTTFEKIADSFFKENPSQAKADQVSADLRLPASLDLALMDRMNKDGYWPRVQSVKTDRMRVTPENRARAVQAMWLTSLHSKNWAAASYFLSEAQKGGVMSLSSQVVTVMKAYTMAQAGARSEAVAELYDERSQFKGLERGALAGYVVSAQVATLSREKVKSMVESLEKESDQGLLAPIIGEQQEAWVIAFGADWSGARLSEQNQVDLLEEAAHVDGRARRKWADVALEKVQSDRKIASTTGDTKPGKPKKIKSTKE